MKKLRLILALLAIVFIGLLFWLLRGADAQNLNQQDIVVDVPDTFEK